VSQRVAACCCQACSDPTLGACCIQKGTVCTCKENKTICECTKLGGVWNANPVCPDACLGACCVIDFINQPIKCLDNMTKCGCDAQNATGQTATFFQGQTCLNLSCIPIKSGCTLWKYDFLRTTRYISYGDSYPTPTSPCRCQDQSALGRPVQSGHTYIHETYYFTAAPYPNGLDYTIYNKLIDDHIYDSTNSGCLDEAHFFEQTTYTKIRDICDQPQNSCNIDRLVYRTQSEDQTCLEPSCALNCVNFGTSSSTITQQSDRTGNLHDCCSKLYPC